MEIRIAKNAGFCFGVRRAVSMAREAAENARRLRPEASVYTLGEIIHNRMVVEQLRSEGIIPIDSPEAAPEGSDIIIRSHGVGSEVYDDCRKHKLNIIDATCPFVANIHRIVSEAASMGKNIYIVGDPCHPEVIGIKGHCGGSVAIIRNLNDAESMPIAPDACVVVQTTFDSALFEQIADSLSRRARDVQIYNTICKTTVLRQAEAEKLSRECNIMLVLGDKHSSNTQKLARICEKNCICTQTIANIDEISLDIFKNNGIIIGVVAGASTPDSIMEVFNTMSEQDKAKVDCCEAETRETAANEAAAATEAANAAQTIEENAVFDEDAITKTLVRIRNGQILTGTVIQIVDGEVSVSIGYKSDGYIPRNEFSNDPDLEPASAVKVGDEIEVEVLKVNDGEGNVLLSRKNVESQKAWEKFSADAESEGKVLEGVCKEVVKGGIILSMEGGAKAFIPASMLSTKYVENLKDFVGQTIKFKVIEVDAKRRRIVGSRKAVLIKEAEEARNALWDKLKAGTKVMGTVRRITDFGAFVDIGGIDGLVHITDASWGRTKNLNDLFTVGQEIEVLILNVDRDKKRVSLGYKQLQPKPWTTADERYPVGAIVGGKVVRIVPFGAFVCLEPTIDGLVHISQLAVKRVANVEDEIKVGDIIRCKVVEVDVAAKRISLSRREAILEENPEIAEELAKEKAERERERHERAEKRAQEEQARQAAAAAREEKRRGRQEQQRQERGERRRREEQPDYELPPIESATTSLATLLGNFVPADDDSEK